jgi:hypothetical protein
LGKDFQPQLFKRSSALLSFWYFSCQDLNRDHMLDFDGRFELIRNILLRPSDNPQTTNPSRPARLVVKPFQDCSQAQVRQSGLTRFYFVVQEF